MTLVRRACQALGSERNLTSSKQCLMSGNLGFTEPLSWEGREWTYTLDTGELGNCHVACKATSPHTGVAHLLEHCETLSLIAQQDMSEPPRHATESMNI